MPRKAAVSIHTRLEFPEELSVHEQYSWRMLMKNAPPEHFLPVDMPAIIQYCRLNTIQSRLYPSVRDSTASKEQRTEFLALTAQLTSLSRLLRIGPSTRTDQRKKASRLAREHEDAYDPDNVDWRQLVGRA